MREESGERVRGRGSVSVKCSIYRENHIKNRELYSIISVDAILHRIHVCNKLVEGGKIIMVHPFFTARAHVEQAWLATQYYV
jgi:hypothetical protein